MRRVMFDLALSAFIAFFVTIEPAGVGPVFVALTQGTSARHKRRMAVKGTLIAAGILFVFAFVGQLLLQSLGIGFAAFRIAGGILLLLLAIDMVFARPSGLRSTTPGEDAEAQAAADISVFPLAIPLLAGPGALTSVLLLMDRANGAAEHALVLGILSVVLAITLAVLLFAGAVTRFLGVTGVNVINRVLGILLAALACQFLIDGARQAGFIG